MRKLRAVLSFVLMLTAALIVLPAGTGNAAAACQGMSSAIYEVGNPTRGSNLYTPWPSEVAGAASYGFTDQRGAPFAVTGANAPGLVAVHRLYHPRTGDFVWIPAGSEASSAVASYGYVDQGVAFYASDAPSAGCAPVFRFVKGTMHRFAASAEEQQALAAAGWTQEKVAFYARPLETAPTTPPPAPGPAPGTDARFSFAVMPDTQNETTNPNDPRFSQRTKWLADNKSGLDLRWVLHSGDVVNWGWLVPSQFTVASNAMKNLEAAGIPYSLALGNHDVRVVGWNGVAGSTGYGGSAYALNPECPTRFGAAGCNSNALVRQTQEFNATFNAARYGAPTVAYEAGKVDNIYQTYSAGGVDWLVLTLEMNPRVEVVSWAKNVVAQNPKRNVIVVTHYYLEGSGAISQSNSGYGATSGQYLYDNLIKVYPNIKMVFSGHVGAAASRTDVGVNGNRIYSFLQAFHSGANPVRLLEIDTAAKTISTKIYTPQTGATEYAQTITDVSFVTP